MKKRIYTLVTVLLIAMLATSPAYAGGVSIKIGLGSITATGYAYGFSKNPVTITLLGKGLPVVTCHNEDDGHEEDAQNEPIIGAEISAVFNVTADKNGKFAVFLEAPPDHSKSAQEMGCPANDYRDHDDHDDDWTYTIDFVYWNYVDIKVVDNVTGKNLWEKSSSCTTTRNPDSITCPAFSK
jgi:hypothetical protein